MNIGAHIFLPTRSLRGGRYQRDIENSKVVQKRTTTWQKTKNDERKKNQKDFIYSVDQNVNENGGFFLFLVRIFCMKFALYVSRQMTSNTDAQDCR